MDASLYPLQLETLLYEGHFAKISFTLFSHLIRGKNGVQARLANVDQVIVDFSSFDVM